MSELKAEQWLDYAGEPRPCYPKSKADKVIAELKSDIRKLLIEYHKTLDSNESLRIAATESMRIVERKNMALMKCRRQIAHLNSLLSNTIIGKLKYNRQFGYWNDKILDEKFKEAKLLTEQNCVEGDLTKIASMQTLPQRQTFVCATD